MKPGIILQKIRKNGLIKSFKLSLDLFRGMLLGFKLGSFNPLFVRGKVRLYKEKGRIVLADFVKFYPDVKLSCVGTPNSEAMIMIGEKTSIGDRTEIHAGDRIVIGKNVMISWDCVIMDRDYHAIGGSSEITKPVLIEDDVLIGCRSIILKGVKVGKGAVIGAGSIVTKDIPEYAVAAGNPARVIHYQNQESSTLCNSQV